LDTLAAPTFLWGGFPARAVLSISYRLIHMGDWRDSVAAKNEETGSTGSTHQVRRWKTLLLKAERVALSLDARPANGCPLFLFFSPLI